MKVTNIKSILPYINFSVPIGVGTSAICFLMKNGNVLKLYINTHLKYELFHKYDMEEHLIFLNKIKNDSYIGPEEILIKNDEVIGYIYPYVPGKVIKNLNNNIKLKSLINAYEKLYKDTILISNDSYKLQDLHQKNIIFNNNIYIIDVYKGYFDESNIDNLFIKNMGYINKTIINAIFNLKFFEYLKFRDDKLDELYYSSLYENPIIFYELLERLFYKDLNKKEVNQNTHIYIYEINPNYYNMM